MNANDQKVQLIVADPTVIGLFGLSMVTLVASSQKMGWTDGLSFVLPWAIFLGSIAQLIASAYDFKHNNLFGANVFAAYGLFWIGVAFSWMVNMGVFGETLKAAVDIRQLGVAFVGYLIFSIFGTLVATGTNKVIFSIMFLIDILFISLSLDAFGLGGNWAHGLAAWTEFLISLLGFYGTGATFLNKFFGKVILPVGKPFPLF